MLTKAGLFKEGSYISRPRFLVSSGVCNCNRTQIVDLGSNTTAKSEPRKTILALAALSRPKLLAVFHGGLGNSALKLNSGGLILGFVGLVRMVFLLQRTAASEG